MANPPAKGPFQVISGDNRGPLITLVSVSFLIVAIIFVFAKVGSAIYFKQRRTALNTPVWIALVGCLITKEDRLLTYWVKIIAIIQVVVLQKAVDNGLGRHHVRLDGEAFETASKVGYLINAGIIIDIT